MSSGNSVGVGMPVLECRRSGFNPRTGGMLYFWHNNLALNIRYCISLCLLNDTLKPLVASICQRK